MPTVPAAETMDDETFLKHLNLRHAERDYAGLRELSGGLQHASQRGLRERYHRWCHEFNGYDHEHQEASQP